VFRVEGDSPDPLIIEDLSISSRGGRAISVEHVGSRTLVLKRSQFSYRGREGAGTVFMEDVTGGHVHIAKGQTLYARQLNMEGTEVPKLLNDGGQAWILGLKAERTAKAPVTETRNGGVTQIWGAYVLPLTDVPADLPMFVSHDARHALMYVTTRWSKSKEHTIEVRDYVGDAATDLLKTETPQRKAKAGGSVVMWYSNVP